MPHAEIGQCLLGFSTFYKPDITLNTIRKSVDSGKAMDASSGILVNGWTTAISFKDFDQYFTTGVSEPIFEVYCRGG
jgi:hypothetical protein